MKKVLAAVDNFFEADIQLMLDENSNIKGMNCLTAEGALYLLHNNIFEKNYDVVRMNSNSSGIVFEVVDEGENE